MPQTIGRHGIARHAENAHGPEVPMHHRLAGPHCDAPEVRASMPSPHQRGLDKVMIANRRAADRDENIGARVSGSAEASSSAAETIAGDAEVDDASAPSASTIAARAKLFEATIWFGPIAPPGTDDSSPWPRSPRPGGGARPSWDDWLQRQERGPGDSSRGAARAASPLRKSRPAPANVLAGPDAVLCRDAIALRLACSCTSTASAPSGTGAPVKMRTASPGPTTPA